MKLIFTHMPLLRMQVRHGTWQGIPAVYKVWDLGDSLEPLLDMQDELDAKHSIPFRQVYQHGSHYLTNAGACSPC